MKKIAVVLTLPVPSGQASVNRILSWTKGLVECGDKVEILSAGRSIDGIYEQMIDGVKTYNFGRADKSFFSLFFSLTKIIYKILKRNYDVIVYATNSLLLIYPLFIVCRITRKKIVQEKSEYPFVLLKNKSGFFNKLWRDFYVNTTYKLLDAIVVISQPLVEYYQSKTRKKCKVFEMPMIVDGSRFNIPKTFDSQLKDYIAYCGDMSNNKDGVINLINSFAKVESIYKDIHLVLIGDTQKPSDLERIKKYVIDLRLNNVIFYGRIKREQMPQMLKNAKILALARPSSLQSTGGFPTKLGEYLSTGNPVVVTAVGDIPRYLNTNNSFLVPPDNNDLFAEAILKILNNYENAKIIGEEGRKVADSIFNYQVQSKRLHQFFNEFL